MWHELRKEIGVELEQLRRLIKIHHALLSKSAAEVPDAIEISALAGMLHSFYTGIENIFKP